MELNKDIITAAEVVLLIIKNEGELEDDIEYPSEFSKAYELLLALDVIQLVESKFLPSENFDTVYKVGLKKFIEDKKFKEEALLRRRNQNNKIGLAIMSSAAIAMAGYYLKRVKRNNKV